MKKWQKGDLVYVPQAAQLVQRTRSGSVSQYMILDSPTTLLVSRQLPEDYEVVYRGMKWIVAAYDTYPIPR